MTRPRRVIKLGGSLLECEGLAERFRAWRGVQPAMQDVVIVGGGRLADVIRDAFARHSLPEEDAHWLCIRILAVTAELAARLLPEAKLVAQMDDLRSGEGLMIFQTEQFLRHEEAGRGRAPLPHTWDVTSDSIAARVADVLEADELVLLKSSLPGGKCTADALATAGYVDRYFPVAAAALPLVRCVNLREEGFPERRLPTSHRAIH